MRRHFVIQNDMKLELTRGCVSGWLGADGIPEAEMDEQKRAEVYEKIFCFLKTRNDGLNQLMQFVLETYGEYESDYEPCETCGDTIERWKLQIHS